MANEAVKLKLNELNVANKAVKLDEHMKADEVATTNEEDKACVAIEAN